MYSNWLSFPLVSFAFSFSPRCFYSSSRFLRILAALTCASLANWRRYYSQANRFKYISFYFRINIDSLQENPEWSMRAKELLFPNIFQNLCLHRKSRKSFCRTKCNWTCARWHWKQTRKEEGRKKERKARRNWNFSPVGETVKNSTNKNQALKCEKIAKSIIK